MTNNEYQYYKHRYFIGYTRNGETQLLHFNKRGYELRKKINKKVVIFSKKDTAHNERFRTIKQSPFSYCQKIPCLQYLYNVKQPTTWWQRLLNFFGLWNNQ